LYYDKLLGLCGYEPDEIKSERPRIERAFEKLEFGKEDIDGGEERIRYYFDIDLLSVRKMLGLWIKSLLDLILAKEEGKKVVYTCMPPFFHILSGLAAVSKDLYVTSPDLILAHTVGGFFGKLIPLLEAAEADLLPAGSAFCSPVQSKLGAINKGIIPIPDLFVSSGFVCDQSPKVDELLGIRYGIPIVYSDGPNDAVENDWPLVGDRRVQYVSSEYKAILKQVEAILGYKVTEEAIHKADLRISDITMKFIQIFDLVSKADPVPTGFVNVAEVARVAKLGINSTTVSGDPESLVDLHLKELQERVKQGKGTIAKGAPRVGIHTFSSFPEPTRMVEDAGLAVVVDFTGLATTSGDLTKSNYEKLWDCSAEILLRFNGIRFAKRIVQVCKEYNLDGAVLNYQIGCRDLCMEIRKTSELITKELGIPVLMIESDNADPRNCISEATRSRVVAFAEMLKSNKATGVKKEL
jgi:benzoyl-CoA reductase/2-hydroxyglutaryl-CoA dehydratase subunit BcrC/BadD/HgdB